MGIIKTTLLEDEAKKYVKAFGELIKQVLKYSFNMRYIFIYLSHILSKLFSHKRPQKKSIAR